MVLLQNNGQYNSDAEINSQVLLCTSTVDE